AIIISYCIFSWELRRARDVRAINLAHIVFVYMVHGRHSNPVNKQPTVSSMCTGITLKAGDGAIVYGRTMEWGTFDLKSRPILIPRGQEFTSAMPDGKPGLTWKGKYGI